MSHPLCWLFSWQILRQKEDANNSRKVFLGGLPSCANEASLHKAFEQAFGPVSHPYAFTYVTNIWACIGQGVKEYSLHWLIQFVSNFILPCM